MSENPKEMEEIKKELIKINEKLDQLLKLRAVPRATGPVVPQTLASLPDHLKKTAEAIATVGEGTAAQVATKTGRTRAAESDYLNQLASRGFLKKERRGREVHFLVFSLYTMCPRCGARVVMTSDHCPICGEPLSKKEQI